MTDAVLPAKGAGSGTPSEGRSVRILSACIFASVFLIALFFTGMQFPPARLSDNISLWTLSYSIHAAVLCGLGALMVELFHIGYAHTPLGWQRPHAFPVYVVLTVLPVVGATFFVSQQASLLMCPDPATNQLTIANIARNLEFLAPLVVFLYLVADWIGWGWGNSKQTYWKLVRIDASVLVVHVIAILGIVAGDTLEQWGGFKSSTVETWLSGAIGLALLFQNVAFAVITARR